MLVLWIRTLEGRYSSKHMYTPLVGAELRGLQKRFPDPPDGWKEEGDVDFREEGYLSHSQPSVRETMFSLEI